MSRKDSSARFVVTARLLGPDKSAKKRGKEVDYAIEVELSDESKYTIFRPLKEVATFNAKLLAKFPVEAGYFKKDERVIPDCPVKQTVFGPQRSIRDDRSFEKLLNSYIKEIPGLPAALVKSDLVNNFFSLRASDLDVPGETDSKKNGRKRGKGITMTETSTITGPMALKSYYAVTSYKDKKGFGFKEGDVIQLLQKDPSGWWMVDVSSGITGWAPASYLVPVDDSTLKEETQENQELIGNERAGARYISISSYQASRDDELSFVRGAVVKVLKKYIDGWWLVRYNGGEGFVPGAMFKKFDRRQATVYVKKIQRNFANRRSTKIMPTLKPNWMTTRRRNPDGSLVRKRNSETKNVAVYQCKAQFVGNAERHEMTIDKGAHVNVLDKSDGGWWFVQDENSRTGYIPATYLQPIVDNDTSSMNHIQDEVVGTDRKVIKIHTAQKNDELSIKVGEIVEVVRASQEGWWLVRSLSTFDQGLVPSVCLSEKPVQLNGNTDGTQNGSHPRLRSSSKSTSNLESETESKSRPPLASRSTSELGSDIVASLKRDLGSEASITSSNSDQYYDDNSTGDQYDESDEDDDDLDSIDLEECYVVTRDYTKLSLDELDVYEGQMVCIIDDSDRDMWYVNADGKEGWLPSNILRAMMEDEAAMTSGESTPSEVKLNSTGASADASDMSDSDDQISYSQKSASSGRPFKRSKVIRKSSSQEPPEAHRPRLDQESSSPRVPRKKSRSDTSSEGEAHSRDGSSITILVGDKTLEELEREVAEAERIANEAKLRAKQLREQVKDAKRRSGSNY